MQAEIGSENYDLNFSNGEFKFNNQVESLDVVKLSENSYHIIRNNKTFHVVIESKNGKGYDIIVNGKHYPVRIKDKLDQILKEIGIDEHASNVANDLKAPMPGLILDVMVNAGDPIEKGQPLLILEAMKMENVIKSPVDGEIKEIHVAKGDSVEKNKVLCLF